MKKQHKSLLWITLVLAVVLTVSAVLFGSKLMQKNIVNTDPQPSGDVKIMDVSLVDYTVYRLDNLDFQFVIAKLRVESTLPVSLGMTSLRTNEGIDLAKTDYYITKLTENKYSLEKQNVVSSFESTEKTMIANVFIPVISKEAMSVDLIVSLDQVKTITLDLTNATGTKEMLGYVANAITTDNPDNQNYSIKAGNVVSLEGKPMFHTTPSGESDQVDFSNTSKIYAVKLDIEPLNGSTVTIEEAKYIITGSTVETSIMDSSYSVEKYTNIFKQVISEKTSGYLYFQLYTSSKSLLDQPTVVELKLKGIEKTIQIKVI